MLTLLLFCLQKQINPIALRHSRKCVKKKTLRPHPYKEYAIYSGMVLFILSFVLVSNTDTVL